MTVPLRFKALVGCHAVIAMFVTVVAWTLPPSAQSLPLTWMAAGVLIGQLGLLAFWLGMGTSPLKNRVLGILVASAYLSMLIAVCPQMGRGSPTPLSAVVRSFLTTFANTQGLIWLFAAGFVLVRKKLCILDRCQDTELLTRSKLQFTVLQILLLTTVVAMLFVLRAGEMHRATSFRPLIVVLLLINVLCGVWSSLGIGDVGLRVIIAIATAALSGLLLIQSTAVERFGWLFFFSPILLTVVPTLVVIVSALVVRSFGYRLRPVPIPDADDK